MHKRIIGISTVDITEHEIEEVVKVLRSKKISPGKVQQKFEKLLGGRHGYSDSTLVNSGQSALHLSIEAIKLLRPSVKYVVCPATTYISTLHAVWNSHLEVILEDVDYRTFNWSPTAEEVSKKYDPETHVLCPVDLMGKSANVNGSWDRIRETTDFFIIEDNCESLIAPFTGYGHFMCLSFYAAHQITTSSGGMVCSRQKEYDLLIKSLCNHGRQSPEHIYAADRNESYDKSKKFIFDKVGFSYKLGDFNAALGLAQTKRVDEIVNKSISNARRLSDKLSKYEFITTPVLDNNTFMNYPIVCKEGVKPSLIKHINNWQIETRDLMPLLSQPVVIDMLNPDKELYPNASKLVDTSFYMGCHGDISMDDIDYVDYVFGEYTV